jgi:putative nucleotidyltransferase with HDIG domain
MMTEEILQKDEADLTRFEPLLTQVSKAIGSPLVIKNLSGEVLVGTVGVYCAKEGDERLRCREEHWKFSKEIATIQTTKVNTCYDGFKIVGVPLLCGTSIIGILSAYFPSDSWSENAPAVGLLEEVASLIAEQVYNQFEIDNMAQELSSRYEELNLIYDLGKKLGEVAEFDKTIQFIVEQAAETLNADIVLASIPKKEILEISGSSGDPLSSGLTNLSLLEQAQEVLLRKVTLAEDSPPHLVLGDIRTDAELKDISEKPMSLLAVPVKLMSDVSGFLCIMNSEPQFPFLTGDVRLVSSLGEQISFVVTNAQLYQDLKNFLLNVVKALVSSIEAKDAYTKGHSERVRRLAMMIAKGLRLPQQEKDELSWAALLHDIGKIGVPEEILSKDGKLTEEEHTVIRDHAEMGYRILMPIDQLKGSLHAIRHHHEKFDGTGYPMGLRRREIPLHARIITVADTYDAMTSDRAYRGRLSDKQALNEMIKVGGSQLDPDIVDTFIELLLKEKQKERKNLEAMRPKIGCYLP